MNYIGGSNTQTKLCGYWRYNEKFISGEKKRKKRKIRQGRLNRRIRSMFSDCKNLKIGRRSSYPHFNNNSSNTHKID